ncbi:MAG: VWA domain-containing protein [Polyangiaceae bacterium]|nr:VWA domain-containing protein [Polyangiaceae bacterium]
MNVARSSLVPLAFVLLSAQAACSDSGDGGAGPNGGGGSNSVTGGGTPGGAGGGGSSGFEGGHDQGTGGGDVCEPPDMLIALDRTLTMHRLPNGGTPTDAPDYQSSKWSQAITAIEGLVTPELDGTIRFGLELWPKEEPGCITLVERVEDTVQATNPFCEEGEVVLSPDLDTSDALHDILDPLTTKICVSTPTGSALLTASTHLEEVRVEGRDQYILLVTDGADWDASCPTPDPLAVTQQLAAGGIKTFVLGFSATEDLMPNGVGAPFLNNMACAGMTAVDFDDNCMMGTDGYVAVDPNGPTLYLQASDGAALSAALSDVAGSICCNCVE